MVQCAVGKAKRSTCRNNTSTLYVAQLYMGMAIVSEQSADIKGASATHVPPGMGWLLFIIRPVRSRLYWDLYPLAHLCPLYLQRSLRYYDRCWHSSEPIDPHDVVPWNINLFLTWSCYEEPNPLGVTSNRDSNPKSIYTIWERSLLF